MCLVSTTASAARLIFVEHPRQVLRLLNRLQLVDQFDGQLRQVGVAPRQLDDTSIPEADNSPQTEGTSNWENERLIYTSGYDIRLAPTNAKTQSDEPDVVEMP